MAILSNVVYADNIGSVKVSPAVDTTYTVVAKNANEYLSEPMSITVKVMPKDIEAAPSAIKEAKNNPMAWVLPMLGVLCLFGRRK